MAWQRRNELSTVRNVVLESAERYGDRFFIEVADEPLSYSGAAELAMSDSAALYAMGVRFGDRVATLYDNSIDALVLWFAANFIGAADCPINSAYKGEFLRSQLNRSGARVLFTEMDYVQRVADIAEGLTDLETVVVRGGGQKPDIPGLLVLTLEEFRDCSATEPPAGIRLATLDDLAMIIWTGGTTGPSKGCSISHGYMMHQTQRMNFGFGRMDPHDVWSCVPLFHSFARNFVTIGTMLSGGSAYLDIRFSVSNFWPRLNRCKADWGALLGSMLTLIANAPETEAEKENTTLKTVSGLPFPQELQDRFMDRWGIRSVVVPAYGLTEAHPITTKAPETPSPAGSSGQVDSEYWELRIVDDEDNDVPVGEAGEVVARPKAPHVMFDGYWGDPQATLDVMRNMWFHAGDIGRVDEDGWFYFMDRKKDYIRRRGENISTWEMENVIKQHPDIQDVCVHAVLSELTEDEVKVTAVLVPESQLTEEKFARWLIERLPYFTVPRYIEFRDALPVSDLSRVQKYQLRDEGVTATTWDIEKSDVTFVRR